MIPFVIYKNFIVIGCGDRILFINSKNVEIITEIQVDIKSENTEETKKDTDSELENRSHTLSSCIIQQLKISPNNEYLAVTTKDQKYLLIYKIISNNTAIIVELLSKRNISRTSSAITFSNDSNNLLLCDKSGDCYLFDCINIQTPGKWILGHLSIVLDVLFTPDQKYIITCDRDEKIRITNYPDTHEIECYCLGHEEFVSSISIFKIKEINTINHNNYYLLSVSGDKTLKIWNYLKGEKIFDYTLEAPIIQHALIEINENLWHLAVSLYQSANENIYIYELKRIENDKNKIFEMKLLSKHNFNQKIIENIYFHNDDNDNIIKLYLIVVETGKISLELLQYNCKSNSYITTDNKFNKLKDFVSLYFKDCPISENEDVSLWFKKKFDNVSEYLERKKKRIEEKKSFN